MPKKPRSPVGPYKLLMVILFGKFKWVERDGAMVRIPLARLAGHMKTRSGRIQEYLYLLEDWGLVSNLRWNPYWFSVTPETPQNMAWIVGAGQPIDILEINNDNPY